MGSLIVFFTCNRLYNKMANFVKMFVILICLTGALSASILAVTPRDKARQLNSIIDKRKEIPDLPNGVREFITLKNYLNHNMAERVTLKDMTEAMVSGITSAFLGKSVAISGVATVLRMVIGWMAALIPADLVTWVLGRDLVVADVLLMETMIEDVVKVYSMWSR